MEHDTNLSPENSGNGPSSTRMVDRLKDKTAAQLNSQKNKATEGLETVATAVRETTENLRSQQHDVAARYAEQAADHIERFSNSLREKDVAELLADAQRLARRRPALFVGTAFALGLLGARFLRSSSADERDEYGDVYGRGPVESRTNESDPDTTIGTPAFTPATPRRPTERL